MPDWAVVGFWTRKVVSELLLLPAGPLAGIVLGAMLAQRRRRLGAAVAFVAFASLVAFSLPVVANALAAPDEADYRPLDPATPLPAHAAIVVLGGGLQQGAIDYGGETVNPTTLARLRSAARLAARTRLPVLVSGGRPLAVRTAEADQMADALVHDFRTPVRWIETASLDTAGNAANAVPLLQAAGIRAAVLVTDVAHMRRARLYFEEAGMPVVPAPTDYYATSPLTVLSFIPNSNALRRSAWTLHEWLGSAWQAGR